MIGSGPLRSNRRRGASTTPQSGLDLPLHVLVRVSTLTANPTGASLVYMAAVPWTDEENDLIVADYFAMLVSDLGGQPYNKVEHNRGLQAKIDRGRSSIEYKHQNISAVLKGLGECWISGYKPAFNFQASLADAVARWLHRNQVYATARPARPHRLEESAVLEFEPPPTLMNRPPPEELEQMLAVARKFDVAGKAERNRALGRAGEERVLTHERVMLSGVGRSDLARSVRWVSEEDGDGAGYDIASFSPEGKNRLIEVKTTNGWERTPFHITRNERAVAEHRPNEWCLVRLWNFARGPRAFELRPPLEAHVTLIATSYEARFH